MDSPAECSNTLNEHDYFSTSVEVPLEVVKTERLDEDGSCLYEETTEQSMDIQSDSEVTRIPIVLRDNKPKLRKKKQSLLKSSVSVPPPITKTTDPAPPKPHGLQGFFPRPIMPKIELPPPNFKGDPPPNCKGVLVVQDVKVCTMYVPKGAKGGNSVPLHTFPLGSLPQKVANSNAPQSLILPCGTQAEANVSPTDSNNTGTNNPPAPKAPETQDSSQAINPSAPLTSLCPSQKPPEGSMISKDPLKKGFYKPNAPKVPETITIIGPSTQGSDVNTSLLLSLVQKALSTKLPMYWFSAVENDGIHVMLLSFGGEKAVQRRVFISTEGSVQISIHCKPLPAIFVCDVVQKAGIAVQLKEDSVNEFSEWIVNVVKVLRDWHICVGFENPDSRDLFLQASDIIYFDDNPYQESRFHQTFRAKNCRRLVHQGKRRCFECSKSFSIAKKRATETSSTKKKLITSNYSRFSNYSDDGNMSSSDAEQDAGSLELPVNANTVNEDKQKKRKRAPKNSSKETSQNA